MCVTFFFFKEICLYETYNYNYKKYDVVFCDHIKINGRLLKVFMK